jgi:hypothetical protein
MPSSGPSLRQMSALRSSNRCEESGWRRMVEATRDFEELFALLKRHGVNALIVGAHAVAFYAKPRYTKDLDVFVEPKPENAARLLAALQAFGFGDLGLTENDFVPGRIVQLGVPPNRVDLITAIDGVTFEEAWRGRVTGRLGSQEVDFIGLEALRRNKRAAARPQDLVDLAILDRC